MLDRTQIQLFLIIICAYIFRGFAYHLPNWYDILLYIPLIREWAFDLHDTVVPDLLLQGGAEIPFNLYKFFAWLLKQGVPENILLECAFLIGFFLHGLACYRIGTGISDEKPFLAWLLLLSLVLPGSFLTFNWHIIPVQAPVSAGIGYPLALLQVVLAFRSQILTATLIGCCNAFIHPSYTIIASVFVLILGICRRTPSGPNEHWAILLKLWLSGLPLLCCVLNTMSSSNLGSFDHMQFFDGLKKFSHHLYPDTHVRDGWGVTLLVLACSVILCKNYLHKFYAGWLTLTSTMFGLYALALINAQYELSPHFALLFLGRAPSLIEPFAIAIFLFSAGRAFSAAQLRTLLGILVLIFGACLSGEYTSPEVDSLNAALCLIGVGFILIDALPQPLKLAALLPVGLTVLNYIGASRSASANLFPSISLAIFSIILICMSYRRPRLELHGASLKLPEPVVALMISLMLSGIAYIKGKEPSRLFERMKVPCPGIYRDFYSWVTHSTELDATFVLRPNQRTDVWFRACTDRKLYIGMPDINQLAYSPSFYAEGIARLYRLGLAINGPRTNIAYDYISFNNYSSVAESILSGSGPRVEADYIVLSKADLVSNKFDDHMVYSDRVVKVYSLTR